MDHHQQEVYMYLLRNERALQEHAIQELRDELVLKNQMLKQKGHKVDKIDFFLSWVYAI